MQYNNVLVYPLIGFGRQVSRYSTSTHGQVYVYAAWVCAKLYNPPLRQIYGTYGRALFLV